MKTNSVFKINKYSKADGVANGWKEDGVTYYSLAEK